MATMTTTEEDMRRSEKLEAQKEKEMTTRPAPKKSRCSALGKLGKAGLVAALALLGHAVKDMARLEAEMKIATTTNYVSVPENTVANMTNYTADGMVALLSDVDDLSSYYAKDVETQFKLIDECTLTYTDSNFNRQWCIFNESKGVAEVFQKKWAGSSDNYTNLHTI